jgi:peptide chain release factor subunit 3
LDAPGHKAYVPNMMAGLAQADIGILVISARKGEFEAGFDRSGQTREHAILAKTIGIKKLVVLINKMDDPTVEWEKVRYDEIVDKLGKFLKGIGFNLRNDVVWLPGAGLSGHNIKDPVSRDICTWFEGPSLLDALDALKPLERMDEAPLRIPVLDKYKESGKTYILGKVESGCLKTGDDLIANPGQVALNVFQIQNDSNIITIARPGENVKIIVKCSQVEEDQIMRGTVMSHPNSLCPVTSDIVGQVAILQLLETKSLFTAGYDCVFHTGTAQEECSVVKLLDLLDSKTGQSVQKLPTFVKEKAVVVCHFTLAKPMCLEKMTDFPQLARFTLRDEGRTIGFGKVLATNAPIRQKKRKEVIA